MRQCDLLLQYLLLVGTLRRTACLINSPWYSIKLVNCHFIELTVLNVTGL